MEQPESPTPSEDPTEGIGEPEAPNPDPDPANEGSGGEHGNGDPDEMYHTLAELVSFHDKLRDDAKAQYDRLLKTEDDLIQQRDEARESGDHMKYALAVRQLDDLRRLQTSLENDFTGDLRAAPPQPQDGDSPTDERSGDSDPGSAGDEQPLAGDARVGVGVGGDGDPDGPVGGDDDPSGGSDDGRAVRPE